MERYEHGGDVYAQENIVLDFSVNLNPFGLPQKVKEAIVSGVDGFAAYPDTKCRALTQAISMKERVATKNILCGNGAADLIYRICMSCKPKKILTIAPTFSEYERAARLSGSQVLYHRLYEQEGFILTDRILLDVTPEIDMMFICNPNNPTGKLINKSLLNRIAKRCMETGTLLVVDECFLSFTEGESILPLIDEVPILIILKAFTKIYAMAGIRLGYILSGNHDLIRVAEETAPCWSVSSVAQTAGIAATQCKGWEEETRKLIMEERAYLSTALKEMGLSVFDSDANFLLIKSEQPLYEPLLQKGILIRRCENYEGLDARFYRIGIKLHPQNKMLILAMMEVLHG